MTNQQKTALFWMSMVVMGVLTLFLLVLVGHLSQSSPTTDVVSFTGEGKITSVPDIAYVDFSVTSTAKTSKAAQDSNSTKSQKVYDFLKSQGIDDKDIETTYYGIQPQYATPRPYPLYYQTSGSSGIEAQTIASYPISDGNTNITGYKATQSYQVKIHDFDKVSTVVDGLVSAGADQVNNVYFDFEDRDALVDQAREKAIADAKAKASDLKRQIGIRLGKITNYYDNYSPAYYGKGLEASVGYGGGGADVPVIPPGESDVTIQVTLTYQIK